MVPFPTDCVLHLMKWPLIYVIFSCCFIEICWELTEVPDGLLIEKHSFNVRGTWTLIWKFIMKENDIISFLFFFFALVLGDALGLPLIAFRNHFWWCLGNHMGDRVEIMLIACKANTLLAIPFLQPYMTQYLCEQNQEFQQYQIAPIICS